MSRGRKQAPQHSRGPWSGGSAGFKHLTLDSVPLVSKTSDCEQSLKVREGRGAAEGHGLPNHTEYVKLNTALCYFSDSAFLETH